MVGGDRSFKLALIEKDKEFSDELREDCEVRGMERSGRGGGGEGGDRERDLNQWGRTEVGMRREGERDPCQ